MNDDIRYLDNIRDCVHKARYQHWVIERESVRKKREKGEPKPWTNDPIIRDYRFCNVRRMDDAVSNWLYDNWYLPYRNHKHMLTAIALARFINKPSSLELITQEVFTSKLKVNFDKIIKILREHRDKGNVIFNGAYMVRGNDGIDKIECVANWYVAPLEWVKIDTDSMENTHTRLLASYGMGSFMAGQIVADLRWAVEGTWEDRNRWAPMGPGSLRGINRLRGKPIKTPMTKAEFDDGILEAKKACQELPELRAIAFRLEAHDYQNTFCEWDKYERALWDEGRPKQKYSGR